MTDRLQSQPHRLADRRIDRRAALRALSASAALAFSPGVRAGARESHFKLATFSADVTPPLGHPLMGGGIEAASRVDDPLLAHGIVFLGAGKPIVLAAIDWCEIRNDAYDRWRSVLADAAGTKRQRVLVACLHQHDAPISDLTAQRLLDVAGDGANLCDLDFHEKAVQGMADALRSAIGSPQRITHVGTGQAKVEKVASTRRILGPDGKVAFIRNSSSNARGHAEPEGNIDPWLKTLSFYDGERPLAAVSCYATHPMSYYGRGGISADFVGLARARRQKDDPAVKQIYLSGCGANITAGKYNDGSPVNRGILADRVYRAMVAAWQQTTRHPLEQIDFRTAELRLPPRKSAGYSIEELRAKVADPLIAPFDRIRAAMGLSWRKRIAAGQPIDVPAIDFGPAQLVLMPGETFVEYQFMAQRMRPDSFVVTAAYGDSAGGYVPLDVNFEEGGHDLDSWSWVAPGSEKAMRAALAEVLTPRDG